MTESRYLYLLHQYLRQYARTLQTENNKEETS